jgi:hypothetical protein
MDNAKITTGGEMVVVPFNELMALARQIIAEQLDGCDEEFMAGRAHGVGSFHSEILELSKRTALAQPQVENETILALHRQLAGEKLRADQGWARAEAKSAECTLLRERITFTCVQAAAETAGAPQTSRSGDLAQEQNGSVEEVLSTLLWLYRRLPRGYGRPPQIEHPIQRLAVKVGINVDKDLAERGPAPAQRAFTLPEGETVMRDLSVATADEMPANEYNDGGTDAH